MKDHSSLPLYVERGGRQFLGPPFEFNNARLKCFILKGARKSLENLIDDCLNRVVGRAVHYRLLTERVILLAAYIEAAACQNPPFRGLGRIRYIEISFWALVLRIEHRPDDPLPSLKLGLFSPYLFLNHPVALLAGREIYGDPKALATIEPSSFESTDPIQVDTDFIVDATPNALWSSRRLLELRTAGDKPPTQEPLFQRMEDFAARFLSHWLGPEENHHISLPHWAEPIHLLEKFHLLDSRLVTLKQFRSVEDPTRACYQGVVEAELVNQNFRGGGLLTGDYQLTIEDNPIYTLAKDLGLSGPRLPVEAAFYVEGDYSLRTGHTRTSTNADTDSD